MDDIDYSTNRLVINDELALKVVSFSHSTTRQVATGKRGVFEIGDGSNIRVFDRESLLLVSPLPLVKGLAVYSLDETDGIDQLFKAVSISACLSVAAREPSLASQIARDGIPQIYLNYIQYAQSIEFVLAN